MSDGYNNDYIIDPDSNNTNVGRRMVQIADENKMNCLIFMKDEVPKKGDNLMISMINNGMPPISILACMHILWDALTNQAEEGDSLDMEKVRADIQDMISSSADSQIRAVQSIEL